MNKTTCNIRGVFFFVFILVLFYLFSLKFQIFIKKFIILTACLA